MRGMMFKVVLFLDRGYMVDMNWIGEDQREEERRRVGIGGLRRVLCGREVVEIVMRRREIEMGIMLIILILIIIIIGRVRGMVVVVIRLVLLGVVLLVLMLDLHLELE